MIKANFEVFFGSGNVSIRASSGPYEKSDGSEGYCALVSLQTLVTPQEIGSPIEDGAESYGPTVDLIFNKSESLQTVIGHLQRMKEKMLKFEKREKEVDEFVEDLQKSGKFKDLVGSYSISFNEVEDVWKGCEVGTASHQDLDEKCSDGCTIDDALAEEECSGDCEGCECKKSTVSEDWFEEQAEKERQESLECDKICIGGEPDYLQMLEEEKEKESEFLKWLDEVRKIFTETVAMPQGISNEFKVGDCAYDGNNRLSIIQELNNGKDDCALFGDCVISLKDGSFINFPDKKPLEFFCREVKS